MSISAPGLSNGDCQDSKLSYFKGESLSLISDGDAALMVSQSLDNSKRRFLVSTVVLSLASRGPVSVDLDEDDPRAVKVILRVLHHQAPDPSVHLDLSLIASIALHADKYDTCTVLEPWVTHWLDALQPTGKSAVDIGLLLLATHMVHARSRFTLASTVAAKDLAKGFEQSWSTHKLLQHIPDATIDRLSEQIRSMARQSRRLIEGAVL